MGTELGNGTGGMSLGNGNGGTWTGTGSVVTGSSDAIARDASAPQPTVTETVDARDNSTAARRVPINIWPTPCDSPTTLTPAWAGVRSIRAVEAEKATSVQSKVPAVQPYSCTADSSLNRHCDGLGVGGPAMGRGPDWPRPSPSRDRREYGRANSPWRRGRRRDACAVCTSHITHHTSRANQRERRSPGGGSI